MLFEQTTLGNVSKGGKAIMELPHPLLTIPMNFIHIYELQT